MATYEYGRIQKLAENLQSACIPAEIIAQIMAGGDAIKKSANPEKKADWLKVAMERIDELLPLETRRVVREGCACCLGGKRLELSRGIAAKYATLEERIQAANQARFVFGNSVQRLDDGRIRVCFFPDNQSSYRCVCLPKAHLPISITYCYCCGGHVKHHLQIALGRSLTLEVESSALASAGSKPCSFIFTLAPS